MRERRIDERGALRFSARWEGKSGTHHGQVRNLSRAGCFVEATAAHVEKGETGAPSVCSGQWGSGVT